MGRTVVLHPGALGDVLLAIPALRALREAGPVVLAAQPRIARLLVHLGVVNGAVDFDTLGLSALFSGERAPDGLSRLLGDARVVSWFGARDLDFTHRLRALAASAVVASSIRAEPVPIWRHLLASVAPFVSSGGDSWREPVHPSADTIAAGSRALAEAGWSATRPLVIVHPGAGGAGKRWPAEGFAEVVDAIVDTADAAIVVHEGPADHEAVAALRARLRVPSARLAEPSLETLAGALGRAALWIGNDSGVSHLAAAVGAPTLALFTDGNLAWRPWACAAGVRVVTVDAVSRSDVDSVLADARRLLATRRPLAAGARGGRE